MSYGRSGLIKCHAEDSNGQHEYVEQKHIQEAFQPQNNHSLALKPKIFIIQVSNSVIKRGKRFGFVVFNATFNNISIISWWSVLLMEEAGVPRENHRSVASH